MIFDFDKPTIAVTGSAGKTVVKTLISAVLRERWVVFESHHNNNTTEKTKQHVKQISYFHRAAVVEYGMAYPGVITEHCNILRPNIGVITNIGLAHIGNFEGKLELLAAAKSELLYGVEDNGMIFTNLDDTNSQLLHTNSFKGAKFTIGIDNESADYRAFDVSYTENGMSFKVILNSQEHEFLIPMFGTHNVYNALFAVAVADKLGFLPQEIVRGLRNVRRPKHRLDVIKLKDGITVIDDTIHAHPPAIKAALDVLETLGTNRQKIVILGSMPELGEKINEYHEDVGRYAATKSLDFLYTYGNISAHISLGAIAAGFPQDKVKHKTPLYRKVLHRELTQLIQPGAIILVKGASRLDMYNTVEFLCEYFNKRNSPTQQDVESTFH
ncbi:hypothetical protein BHU72_12995 [Desulfuribacillus stibiiarsenatis]|uniref:UDP-N-acetylmuramoyl-tripeptide--D-alanyl-D-alanine ligase n=1 Tax=Desulfuribacillus stibiiarsenatis TaxID=1390249 RepID=A0A1E5L8P2_9FIRM|nr:UDP-N-acetylmuramoyl-tripeptide--D-alanyl-D-alanine ligase [Desulfuribacillus stibiiarsenatis]OEH86522.1 hypothetical protein BHU72_12995 [Desulfuribacillus stibiiarsenatis]